MKFLRRILLILLVSLLVGLAIGTAMRMRLERPIRYIGSATVQDPSDPDMLLRNNAARCFLAVSTRPLDVHHIRASVLDPRHHEQHVG